MVKTPAELLFPFAKSNSDILSFKPLEAAANQVIQSKIRAADLNQSYLTLN